MALAESRYPLTCAARFACDDPTIARICDICVRGRSDCHAWGAHPLYHLLTGVAGIRPVADGFSAVEVAPQFGGLKFIKVSLPTPKGMLSVDLRRMDDRVTGTVTVPPGLPADFVWKGSRQALRTGVNVLGE